jgi:hypothetical protein
MPRVARSDGVTWARPWLATPREAIEAYARSHRLRWIDDDSNDDPRFARNRLRLHVWPALVEAFGDAEAALAAAAERSADAASLLADVGAADAASISGDDGLDLARWRALSPPRRRQALVEWLRGELATAPPASLVARLLDETTNDDHRRWPAAAGELRSYRGRVRYETAAATANRFLRRPDRSQSPGVHALAPWRGAFRVDAVERRRHRRGRSRTSSSFARALLATASRPVRDGRREASSCNTRRAASRRPIATDRSSAGRTAPSCSSRVSASTPARSRPMASGRSRSSGCPVASRRGAAEAIARIRASRARSRVRLPAVCGAPTPPWH